MANTYNPKLVSLIVDGTFITGFMDGTFISTEKNEDDVTPHVGALGDVTYAISADETGTITFTLKQTSGSLPFLTSLRNEKRMFPIQIVDNNENGARIGGNEAMIVKLPSREYSNEVAGVEVAVHVSDFTTN